MAAAIVTSRERWIAAGLEALAERGPEAVRVEVLAAKLGVTKGGFYGHFEGRAALLAELLDEWEKRCTNEVLATVAAEGGDGAEQIRRVGQLTFFEKLHRLDLAVRGWAHHDRTVARRLRKVDTVRLAFLRKMFGAFIDDPEEIEARSTLAFALAIGRHFIAAKHPGRTKRDMVQRAGAFLLRPPGGK